MPVKHTRDRRGSALAAMLVIAAGVTACGGSGDTAPRPSITDPSELLQDVALTYGSQAAATEPTHVEITQGQMVFIAVRSDVAGTVTVEGHDVAQGVRANKVGTLIISANDAGTFDVMLTGKGIDTKLAELEIAK